MALLLCLTAHVLHFTEHIALLKLPWGTCSLRVHRLCGEYNSEHIASAASWPTQRADCLLTNLCLNVPRNAGLPVRLTPAPKRATKAGLMINPIPLQAVCNCLARRPTRFACCPSPTTISPMWLSFDQFYLRCLFKLQCVICCGDTSRGTYRTIHF
jgi:hypothetical protein